MECKNTRKTYNANFKTTVVELYYSDTPVKTLSNKYALSNVTIYKWIKEFTPIGT